MKILFTSDVHGIKGMYSEFSQILKNSDFDCGVIAGDNQRDLLPDNEVIELLNLDPDAMVEVLAGEDDGIDEIMANNDPFKYQIEALNKEAEIIINELDKAGKPVFIISGNHDQATLKSSGNVHVLNGMNEFKFGGYKFIGYEKTNFETNSNTLKKELKKLYRKVNRKTILVTHAPAYGILDKTLRDQIIGEKMLRKIVDRKKPALHLFGHVHESVGHKGISVNGCFLKHFNFFSVNVETKDVEIVKTSISKKRKINIQIFGENELRDRIREGLPTTSHCISIRNSTLHGNGKMPFPLPNEIENGFKDILHLEFYDLEKREWLPNEFKDARIPEIEDVEKVIEFVKRAVGDPELTGFTIHCWRGVSRSSAVALGIAYMLYGDERLAAKHIQHIRPEAAPLPRIVEFWDKLFGSNLVSEAERMREERFAEMRREFYNDIEEIKRYEKEQEELQNSEPEAELEEVADDMSNLDDLEEIEELEPIDD